MAEYICGDCLEKLKTIETGSIDLVLTSPPYADQIKNYGEKCKKLKPSEYNDWFIPISSEIFRVLNENGSFILNINDKVNDNFQDLFVYKLVVRLCEEIGFNLVRDYIWYNPATPPNVFSRGTMGRTKKSHEYCFWFSKSEKWKFNMDPIRKPYSNSMGRLLENADKGDRNENTRPSRHNFNLSKKWKNHGGADPGSVLTISNTSSNDILQKLSKEMGIKHPARFPKQLAEFFVLAGSNEGDVILDPFAGSGTTAVVAQENNRDWICIDINEEFKKLAEAWIAETRRNNIK